MELLFTVVDLQETLRSPTVFFPPHPQAQGHLFASSWGVSTETNRSTMQISVISHPTGTLCRTQHQNTVIVFRWFHFKQTDVTAGLVQNSNVSSQTSEEASVEQKLITLICFCVIWSWGDKKNWNYFLMHFQFGFVQVFFLKRRHFSLSSLLMTVFRSKGQRRWTLNWELSAGDKIRSYICTVRLLLLFSPQTHVYLKNFQIAKWMLTSKTMYSSYSWIFHK